MLPITQNFLLLCCASAALISLLTAQAGHWICMWDCSNTVFISVLCLNESHLNKQGEHKYEEVSASNVTALCLFWRKQRQKDDRNGMRGVGQDKVAVLIVFLRTSACVSHYCVQTRGDVFSAETSKSPAPGCNLVTSFSLLLPALLASGPSPAVNPLPWWGRLNA